MTEIYLIRHGEAESNLFRRIQGWSDCYLTGWGRQQVKYLEKRFENIYVDACFSSDLLRARMTACAVYKAKNLPLQVDPAFREVGFGRWEDLPGAFIDKNDRDMMHIYATQPRRWSVEGSETFEQFTGRFIDAMTRYAREYDGKTIAIVAHNGVLRNVLLRLFFEEKGQRAPEHDNTAVSHLFYDNGKYTYDYLADNSHVPQELSVAAFLRGLQERFPEDEIRLYFRREDLADGVRYVGISGDKEIGSITLDPLVGQEGSIRCLDVGVYYGRTYDIQLFGQAVSHFRNLGAKSLCIGPGILSREALERIGVAGDRMDLTPENYQP